MRDAAMSGTIAGLAMVPPGLAFRVFGLRINEYGRKTLTLLIGDVVPPLQLLLGFVQHLVISWIAAAPLLLLLGAVSDRRARVLVGAGYGTAFYVVVNGLALPLAFGDPRPWELGVDAVYPSLVVHLVYGVVVALTARSVTAGLLRPAR